MRILTAALLVVVACGAPSAPAEPAPPLSIPPLASSAPSAAVAPTAAVPADPAPAPKSEAHFRVTAAMKMGGTVDDKALVVETNAQIEKVSACAAVVRKTDRNTSSLNLQVEIAKNGTVKGDLRSPVSDEGKSCILDAVAAWKLSPKIGAGNAMVLLSFVD